jgi:hypothetical protein
VIKLLLILSLLISNAWARVNLELVLNQPSVKQGEISEGKLIVKQTEGQSGLPVLKGKNIGKTLYLLNASPFMGKQGQLESEVKFIFFTVPQTNALLETVNGEEIFISWNNIEVIPTEASKTFLLGDFEIPSRKKILNWILIILGICLVTGISLWVTNYFKKKKASKDKINKLKQELINCTSYEDIVLMWREKHRYLDIFPNIDSPFRTFEDVLFKYQFKSHRSEQEVAEVVSAYQKFKTEVLGVLNGI